MNQQTGDDRETGTAPPPSNQEPPAPAQGQVMAEPPQAGVQMDNQPSGKDAEQRRQQAGQQSDRHLGESNDGEKGFGYGADGEEMADAPDTTQPDR